jgi:hypothetical protein
MRQPSPASAHSRAAAGLSAAPAARCDRSASFERQVGDALEASLSLFSTEPNLARTLVVEPYRFENHASPASSLGEILAARLRAAAEADPTIVSGPSVDENDLLGGTGAVIARRSESDGIEDLGELAPELQELIIGQYRRLGR